MFNSNGTQFTMPVMPASNGGGMGFGDGAYGGWFWIIIIIILFGGWGWGGNYGAFGSGGATNSGITDGYILTSDFAKIESKLDSVNNGICSLGYDQLSQMNNINQNVSAQGAAVQNAITQQTIAEMQNVNAINAGITGIGTQLASCCCDMRYENATKFSDLNYRLAEQSCQTRQAIYDSTAAITANQDANTRAILDFMTQDKIATLTSENAALKAAANNAAQTYDIVNQLRTPSPIPAYVVANPYCNCNCNSGGCC